MVTNKAIYIIAVPTVFNNLFGFVSRLKRRNSLEQVFGMTVSKYGLEFVIHLEK
jgi:hypothetical protein